VTASSRRISVQSDDAGVRPDFLSAIRAYTGARRNEITMRRPEDIDLESGIDVFRIRGDATKPTGTGTS
jgi:integrase